MTLVERVPDRGDVVWISLNPQAGHEQAGRRPALVLSPAAYNRAVGLALLCPITNQVKRYPFEVAIPGGLSVSGVVLSDQVKSLDWRARSAEFVCGLPVVTTNEVLQKLHTLLCETSGVAEKGWLRCKRVARALVARPTCGGQAPALRVFGRTSSPALGHGLLPIPRSPTPSPYASSHSWMFQCTSVSGVPTSGPRTTPRWVTAPRFGNCG